MVEEKKSSSPEVPKTEIIHDHPVFQKVEDGDLETIQNYFEVEGLSLEILDQHGMSPLMHASWKGTYDVTKYLIKQGKDLKMTCSMLIISMVEEQTFRFYIHLGCQ